MESWIGNQFYKIIQIFKTVVIPDENSRKWKALKGKYAGKRVFLIGNGPSLNETPLYMLRDEHTMCFNRFYMLHERINWFPKFFMCVDPLVLPDISDELNKQIGNFGLCAFLSIHKQYVEPKPNIQWVHGIVPLWYSRRLPLVGKGSTVAFQAFQVLSYLGFSEIYLIGVDQNYQIHKTAKVLNGREIESSKDDDPNHFDPRYFGKGRKYHQPDEQTAIEMIKSFEVVKEAAEKDNFKVVNAGFNSELNVFERKNFYDLFDYDDETLLSLFLKSFPESISREYIKEQISKDITLIDHTKDYSDFECVLTNIEDGKKLTQKIIYTHIPFGPYRDKIFFVNRSML